MPDRAGTRPAAADRASRRRYLIMALVSCAVLLYEIAVTRLLSVILWYHFAFLAISLAMLGLGVPGVWFALRPPRRSALQNALVAAGVAVPLSVAVALKWLARLGLAGTSPNAKIALTILCLLVPLLLLGSAVCVLLLEARGRRIGRMYAADLLGATAGACLVVPLLDLVPTPGLLAAVGFLPLAGATLISRRQRRRGGRWRWRPEIAAALALVVALVWGEPFRLRHSKNYAEPAGRLYERWTPTARLTVFPGSIYQPDRGMAFGWGFGSRYPGGRIEQYWVDQDGSAGTPITRHAGSFAGLEHLFYDVTSVGYQLRPPRGVCIVGAGGGRDILTALKAGAERVDAVELNRHLIDLVSGRFGDFSGDPYHLPGVRAFASEGRSFLTRTDTRYDLIQISLIDSWAATTAGAYALSENYLYTEEALRLDWSRLTDRGLISISRWSGGSHQLESTRLALLVRGALGGVGVGDPLRHLAIVEGGHVATALISRSPFDAGAVARLDAIAAARGFARRWPIAGDRAGAAAAGDAGAGAAAADAAAADAAAADAAAADAAASSLIGQVLTDGAGDLEAAGLHLTPPTDDRPFFFQNVRAFTRVDRSLLGRLSINDQAARLPRFLIGSVGLATLALFLAPFMLAGRLGRGAFFWRGSAYFVAIGAGFMLVEVPFIQKFVLYLGHPSYATTVVLSTVLLGSGLGSLVAGRSAPARIARWRLALPVGVALINLVLPAVFRSTLGWSFAPRVAVSLALVGPLGFLLGFAFPTGMIRFGDDNRAWYWAMNGTAAVLASVTALTLAAYVGLTGVVWIGAAAYVIACVTLPAPAPVPAPR